MFPPYLLKISFIYLTHLFINEENIRYHNVYMLQFCVLKFLLEVDVKSLEEEHSKIEILGVLSCLNFEGTKHKNALEG